MHIGLTVVCEYLFVYYMNKMLKKRVVFFALEYLVDFYALFRSRISAAHAAALAEFSSMCDIVYSMR